MRFIPTIFPSALDQGILAVVLNAIVGTGASASTFTVPCDQAGAQGRDVTFTPDTLTAMTTLTADLEASGDGGVTWTKFKTGLALIATSVPAAIVVTNVPSGLIYRLNVTTFSGTSASVTATVS